MRIKFEKCSNGVCKFERIMTPLYSLCELCSFGRLNCTKAVLTKQRLTFDQTWECLRGRSLSEPTFMEFKLFAPNSTWICIEQTLQRIGQQKTLTDARVLFDRTKSSESKLNCNAFGMQSQFKVWTAVIRDDLKFSGHSQQDSVLVNEQAVLTKGILLSNCASQSRKRGISFN